MRGHPYLSVPIFINAYIVRIKLLFVSLPDLIIKTEVHQKYERKNSKSMFGYQ